MRTMWSRHRDQCVWRPGDQKEQTGRLFAPPGLGLPQSQALNAGSPRIPVPLHRGTSNRNQGPQACWHLSALLKCLCCLCCLGLAEPSMSSLVSLGLRGARDQCKHHETRGPDVWIPGLGELGVSLGTSLGLLQAHRWIHG